MSVQPRSEHPSPNLTIWTPGIRRLDPRVPFVENHVGTPRVELLQPLLKKNIVEIMLGPKADDAAKVRVRTFLDENQLPHMPVTVASARLSGEGSD